MPNTVICYARPDGGVSVIGGPAPVLIARFIAGGATLEDAIAFVRSLDVPGGRLYETVSARRLGRKSLITQPPPKGLGLTEAEAEAQLDAEARVAQASQMTCDVTQLPNRRDRALWTLVAGRVVVGPPR